MQASISFWEKCKEVMDQIGQQVSRDSVTLKSDWHRHEQNLVETEMQLKECIDWKRLGAGVDYLRYNAKLSAMRLPIITWVMLLGISWGIFYLVLIKWHSPLKPWVSLVVSCALAGYLQYWMSNKRVDDLPKVIKIRLMKHVMEGNEEDKMFKYEFREMINLNQKEHSLAILNILLNVTEKELSNYAIGLFNGNECIGFIIESEQQWRLYTNNNNPVLLNKMAVKNKIHTLMDLESNEIANLQIFLDKLQQVSSMANCSLTPEQIRQAWSNIVLNPNETAELARSLVAFSCNQSAPRGILLKGPPGTGKSITAHAFAKASGASFFKLTVADIKGQHIGSSGVNVKNLWKEAREKQPAIIFVDECEGVFARRGSDQTDQFVNEIVQNFLTEWDGVGNSGRILVMGATNRAELLDDAILSRFTDVVELLPADASSRTQLVKSVARQVGITTEISTEVVNTLIGLSGRDLRTVMEKAKRIAMSDSLLLEHYQEAVGKTRGRSSTKVASNSTWDTLVLPEIIINRLKALCQMVRDAEVLTAKGIPVPKTLLLYGPPGTGKTQIARTLANEAGVNFVAFSTADLKGQYLGHAANRVKQAFESARMSSPSIVFIDEIDALTSSRTVNNDQLQTEALTQLLQELDGVSSKSGNVLVIAATNMLPQIDSAILSRFSQQIEIGLPSNAERASLLMSLLNGRPVTLKMNLTELAERCEGYSGRELNEFVTKSFNFAVERVMGSGGSVTETELTDMDIERALL